MAKNNNILVPEARKELDQLKDKIMKEKGYDVVEPGSVKYEIASELGIPLTKEDNGNLTSKEAGKIGGPIGGSMVKAMVKMAQEQMIKK